MAYTRQTAHKVWVADLLNAKYVEGAGEFDSNYFSVRDVKVSRVNVIGIVVGREDKEGFAILSIDDGSGNISLRLWGADINMFSGLSVGDVVLVIGRVRMFGEVRYILPEVVKGVTPSWAKLRRMELNRQYGDPIKIEKFDVEDVDTPPTEVVEEPVVDVIEDRGKVLNYIEVNDTGEGVALQEVIDCGVSNAEKVVQELLKDGEIFEVEMGKLRLLP